MLLKAVSSSRGEGNAAEDEGVSPGGRIDGIGWNLNQRLQTISAEKMESVHVIDE